MYNNCIEFYAVSCEDFLQCLGLHVRFTCASVFVLKTGSEFFSLFVFVTVVDDVKLSESEKRLEEVDNKCEVLTHTLRDKQAACDLYQTHVDVSCFSSLLLSAINQSLKRHKIILRFS